MSKVMSRKTSGRKVESSLLLASPGSEEGRRNLEMVQSSERKLVKDGEIVTNKG